MIHLCHFLALLVTIAQRVLCPSEASGHGTLRNGQAGATPRQSGHGIPCAVVCCYKPPVVGFRARFVY